jgi:hypothetical protein
VLAKDPGDASTNDDALKALIQILNAFLRLLAGRETRSGNLDRPKKNCSHGSAPIRSGRFSVAQTRRLLGFQRRNQIDAFLKAMVSIYRSPWNRSAGIAKPC